MDRLRYPVIAWKLETPTEILRKRISDRVEMIQNQVVIQRSSYDRLNKDYLGKTECDRSAELSRLKESAVTAMILAAELYSAVQTEIRQEASS